MPTKEQARLRAELITKVRAGQLTAKAAAAQLGVSRKTYYEWEARGLGAMLRQLEEQPAGRPPANVPAEVAALQAENAELRRQLSAMAQTAEIRAMLRAMEKADAKKKRPPSRKSSP